MIQLIGSLSSRDLGHCPVNIVRRQAIIWIYAGLCHINTVWKFKWKCNFTITNLRTEHLYKNVVYKMSAIFLSCNGLMLIDTEKGTKCPILANSCEILADPVLHVIETMNSDIICVDHLYYDGEVWNKRAYMN